MKTLSSFMSVLLVFTSLGFADRPALAAEPHQGSAVDTPQVAKIKAQVRKHGTGENSKVRVTLANGTVLKGNISKIEETSFDVNGGKTGQATSISYTDARKIQGPGLSTGAKVAIVVVIGAAVVAVVIAVGLHKADNGLKGPI